MRQNISPEQLDQLSPSATKRLLKWCAVTPTSKGRLLTIGECIQFLDEHYGSWSMDSWQDWEVINTQDNGDLVLGKSTEPIDALWEAVKAVLEKEDA